VRIDHREDDGSIQRQWYFEATMQRDDIHVVGPEIESPERGSYRAVWIGLNDAGVEVAHPSAVARLIVQQRGDWPPHVIEIDET
jgi:hypothetical protein